MKKPWQATMKRALRLKRLRQDWHWLASPLVVSLLAAAAVHGLWLSYLQLRRSGQPSLPVLTAKDDTPELLRFSRRLPLEGSLATVPLPPASTLPPPPPDLLTPLPQATRAPSSAVPPPGSRPKTRIATGNARRSATGGKAPRSPGQILPGAPTRTETGREAATDKGAELDSEDLPATLASLRRLAMGPAEDGEGRGPQGKKEPVLLRAEGPAAKPYEKLWDGAQPAPDPGAELKDLPPGVDVRSLPLARIPAGMETPGHRQAVLLGTQVLLFWIDGPTLWLLRAPLG